jgi:hypothetical protein
MFASGFRPSGTLAVLRPFHSLFVVNRSALSVQRECLLQMGVALEMQGADDRPSVREPSRTPTRWPANT